jgi:signal transduction histidine kinase
MLGYVLLRFIFLFTGRPPEAVAFCLSGLGGIFAVAALVKLYTEVRHIVRGKKGHTPKITTPILEETLTAINSIAQGNFNVFIPTNAHDPFSEVAEQVNRMAHELNSMEDLRQDFISNVSHEIQSPLTSISGFTELLKNPDLDPEKRAHYLGIIEAESKRLSRLSDNLLKLSSLEDRETRIQTDTVDLAAQLENVLLMLEPQWSGKHLTLNADLTRVSVPANEDLLRQLWINLIGNAIKFTPDEGSITVTLVETDTQVICRITDTGPGIAPPDLVHIFERFYKADISRNRALGGSGLGLALAKRIADIHDATIEVESVHDSQTTQASGTTFTVTLPL